MSSYTTRAPMSEYVKKLLDDDSPEALAKLATLIHGNPVTKERQMTAPDTVKQYTYDALLDPNRGPARGPSTGFYLDSDVDRIVAEKDARIAELEDRNAAFYSHCLEWRGLGEGYPICKKCNGAGIRLYGSTATWRGGIGGQTMTNGVCDACWGSGRSDYAWPSHRERDALKAQLAEKDADIARWKATANEQSDAAIDAANKADALCQHHLTWRSCTDYGKGETVTMSEHSGDPVNPPFAGIAWLIETNDPIGNVLYYCGQGDWCCNPNHAMKWPSKEAAEKSESWTQMQYPGNMRIAEHEWVKA